MLNIQSQGRQGDVLIRKVSDDTPLEGEPVEFNEKENFLTVVKGEATNHHHGFSKSVPVVFKGQNEAVNIFLVKITEPTEFQHFNVKTQQLTKEHSTQLLQPGTYEIRSQREGSSTLTSRGFQQQTLFRPAVD